MKRFILFIILTVCASMPVLAQFLPTPTLISGRRVSGGGGPVACDYGPNTTMPTGTIGTDLTTAGFTHCALNADFTDGSGSTVSGGWIMSNLNTYVNECAGTTVKWKFWLKWIAPGLGVNADSGGDAPCNRLAIASDGAFNVLQYSFSPSDEGVNKSGIGLYWPLCGDSCVGSRPALPVAHYVEVTYKLASGATQTTTSIINIMEESLFSASPSQGSAGFLDGAVLEAVANNGNTASSLDNYGSSCGTKCSAGYFWVPDLFNYHTFSYLISTDGSSNLGACFYYDGALVPSQSVIQNWTSGRECGNWGPTFTSGELVDHDQRVFMFIGDFACNPCTINNTITINIKNIRVFTCANYVGSGNDCTGTVVTGH